MRRLALLVLVGWAVAGGVAQAHTQLVLPDGSTPQLEQRWIAQSKMPTPSVTIHFHRGHCLDDPTDDAGGCTLPGPNETPPFDVWLWDTPDAFVPASRGDLYHELGHVFDYTHPTGWWRWRFEAIMHMPATPWEGNDKLEPKEQFAEAYKFCAKSPTAAPFDWWQNYGYDPSVWQHRKACRLIARVAKFG